MTRHKLESPLSIFSLAGPLSLIIAQVVMGLLSKRLGQVTKRAPIYRWFYVGAGLVGLSALLEIIDLVTGDTISLSVYVDLLLVLGLALSLIVAWQYWSWLLSEQGRKA